MTKCFVVFDRRKMYCNPHALKQQAELQDVYEAVIIYVPCIKLSFLIKHGHSSSNGQQFTPTCAWEIVPGFTSEKISIRTIGDEPNVQLTCIMVLCKACVAICQLPQSISGVCKCFPEENAFLDANFKIPIPLYFNKVFLFFKGFECQTLAFRGVKGYLVNIVSKYTYSLSSIFIYYTSRPLLFGGIFEKN